MRTLKKELIFEQVALALYGVLLLALYLLYQIDIKKSFLTGFTLSIPVVLLFYYSLKSKNFIYSLIIFLTALPFLITILSISGIYHSPFTSFLVAVGQLSVIALIGLVLEKIFRHKYKNDIKFISILLLVIVVAKAIFPGITMYYDSYSNTGKIELLNYPILILLIYLYFQKGLNILMPFTTKSLMINYVTLIWINLLLTSK